MAGFKGLQSIAAFPLSVLFHFLHQFKTSTGLQLCKTLEVNIAEIINFLTCYYLFTVKFW